MLRLAVTLTALALGGAMLDGDAEAGKRKSGKRGKVVRVERAGAAATLNLGICQLSGGMAAVCYGHAPRVGDGGAVIDTTASYGEARITAVTPMPDSCNNVTSWSVTIESSASQVAQLTYGSVLVLDFAASQAARTLPTSGQVPVSTRANETQYVTIDRDGDTDADIYVSAYTCDANAVSVPWGQGQVGYCMGYYVDGAHGWSLLRTDVVRSC